ncbi:MAG: S49 family peptidase [Candidatus Eisenbacteria bacterium]
MRRTRTNFVVAMLILTLAVTVVFLGTSMAGSEFPPYRSETEFMLTPPGAIGWEGYGFTNPATLTYVTAPDLLFAWRGSESGRLGPNASDITKWGIFTAVPGLGFGAIHEKNALGSITDYRLSLATGTKRIGFGASYGWSSGDRGLFNRTAAIGLGALLRPARFLSVGLSGRAATEGGDRQGILDVGIRPLGRDFVTLFGDYAVERDQMVKNGSWSAGAALRVAPGIHITSRYFGDNATQAVTAGLSFDLGRIGLSSQAHYDNNQHRAYNTYRVRAGAYNPNILDTYVMPERKYVELDLFGPLKYQRFRMFDESNTLAGVLALIEAAKTDPRVAGIAVKASGAEIGREIAWEIREQLRDFKSTGKPVIIFLDNGNIDAYHFASVADKIVLDPTGMLIFEGFLMGRTFLKGTLEKVGLGFDEWRFFRYKSAEEPLSRDSMSEGDREQRQRLVDEYYRVAKSEICAARAISPVEFDRLVNEETILLPADALKLGLVDTLARWDAAEDVIKSLEGKKKKTVTAGSLGISGSSLAALGGGSTAGGSEAAWGDAPEIAIIYAIGECAMDTGIKARSLVKDVEAVTQNSRIKAVVLRVDSPGGDALASDIVAEATKKCAEKKPVIVSQGAVAGSGGYWLSMYGTSIVAAPITITGSIGVIGGWLYNVGIKEKLGMTTDHVMVGKHADLGFGMRLPLIGAGVPDRNLTSEERAKIENMIKVFYQDFVGKVAVGRKMKSEAVDEVGQGRVWSGADGKDRGLVDVLGGLETAIMLAKEKAGIKPDREVAIVELPRPELFNMGVFTPKLIGVAGVAHRLGIGGLLGSGLSGVAGLPSQSDPLLDYLKFRLEHNGQPMPMMPLEDLDMLMEAQTGAGN